VVPEQLRKWLIEGINRKDIGGEEIPELGFAASFQAGEDTPGVTLRINCSVYSAWVNNTCTMTFPRGGETVDRILDVPILTGIAKAVILSWQPDHGVITSHECSSILSPQSFYSEAGWMTYLSAKYTELSAMPREAVIDVIGDGRLIIATMERFSSANTKHMETVRELASILNSWSG
jgi:hypothetical protein